MHPRDLNNEATSAEARNTVEPAMGAYVLLPQSDCVIKAGVSYP